MTLPWLVNQWACSAWDSEPGREAASDQPGTEWSPGPSLRDVLGETPLAPAPERTEWNTEPTAAEWYESFSENWETLSDVIPPENRITSGHLHDVKDFVNDPVRHSGEERTKIHCFDYAHFQVDQVGFKPSGRADRDNGTLWLLYEYPEPGGVREECPTWSMVEAIVYIKDRLQAGMPVLVGVRINGWSERPNQLRSTPFTETTNHYVVIVGMGTDGGQRFFNYYDYRHQPEPNDRLVLQPDLRMTSPNGYCTLSELRRIYRR